jgi:excisionase family DNA binding protein
MQSERKSEKLLYPKKEAAAMLSISTKTVERMIACGQLKARRVGKRVLIQRAELVRFSQRDHVSR